MRGGVCCHRGRVAASVSDSGALTGVVVENAHAEVRTRVALDGRAGRSDDEAVDTSDWSGRLEAIEAVSIVEQSGGSNWGGQSKR